MVRNLGKWIFRIFDEGLDHADFFDEKGNKIDTKALQRKVKKEEEEDT